MRKSTTVFMLLGLLAGCQSSSNAPVAGKAGRTAAIAHLTHTSGHATGTALSVTTPAIDTTGADFAVAAVAYWLTIPQTVTDSKGNTWTGLMPYAGIAANQTPIRLFYSCLKNVGMGHTFTVSSPGAAYQALAVKAYSGVKCSYDAQNGAVFTATATNFPTGSITTPQAGDLIVSAISNWTATPTPTINSGLAIQEIQTYSGGNNFGIGFADLIQSAAGSISPTWVLGSQIYNAATIAAFPPASAPLPMLTSITPSSGNQGATVNVTLAGSNLAGASINAVNGITVSNVVPSASQVTATFTIASTAIGAQSVTVTTGTGISNVVTFTIIGPPMIVQKIIYGTTSLLTTAIPANSCDSSPQAVSAPGALASDVIAIAPASSAAAAGYGAKGMNFSWFPSSNTINFVRCNVNSSSQAPGGLNVNWSVLR